MQEPNLEGAKPEERYLRIGQIIGDPKANPPVLPIIEISRTHWYAGIRDGIFPAPIKVGRASLWSLQEVRQAIRNCASGVGE